MTWHDVWGGTTAVKGLQRVKTAPGPGRRWTLDDIPWGQFDPSRVDPDLLQIVKAAAMAEYNGGDYAAYLCNVFPDDPDFQEAARVWAAEEVQNGRALGRWAQMADSSFDFERSFARFTAGFSLPLGATASVRGSRTGELVVLGRIGESEDDELAYAYYAANGGEGEPYERKRWSRAYASRTFGYVRPRHVERGMRMTFKATGLRPHGRLARLASRGGLLAHAGAQAALRASHGGSLTQRLSFP